MWTAANRVRRKTSSAQKRHPSRYRTLYFCGGEFTLTALIMKQALATFINPCTAFAHRSMCVCSSLAKFDDELDRSAMMHDVKTTDELVINCAQVASSRTIRSN
jgi:hypothetical protein